PTIRIRRKGTSLIDLDEIRQKARSDLARVDGFEALEAWRLGYLGRRGEITLVLRGLGELPAEERREMGARANKLREEFETAMEERRLELEKTEIASIESEAIDVTLPGRPNLVGRLHPITQTLREALGALGNMGFQVAE